MVIGVSGRYCSGKNYLSSLLAEKGWKVVDVDEYAHKALQHKSNEVISHFGQKICNSDGSINRRKLGEIVFASSAKMQLLEEIIHPLMYEWTKQFCSVNRNENHGKVAINAAVLYKMKLYQLCDAVFWVTAPFWIRMKRAMRRDSLSFFQALKRLLFQRKLKSKHLSKFVDIYTIRNDGKADLSLLTDSILESI
jgi:dephospho-CoA kinase